jgi:RND superfamily putative drug exporter
VVIGWVGILIVLVGLVITVGGSLRDEFEIPGSDTQRATDLIESKFASEQGGVLNIVFAAPAGQQLDTPERKAAIEKAIALIQTAPYTPRPTRPASRAR